MPFYNRTALMFLSLLLALGYHGSSRAENSDTGLEKKFIVVDEVKRSFFIHVPKEGRRPLAVDTKARIKKPVVFMLHGGGGGQDKEIKNLAEHTGWLALSDKEGFVLVLPQGLNKQWNDGRDVPFPFGGEGTNDVDDVGFIEKVIDQLEVEYRADPKRIYVTGLSNGGMMTYRLGIELSSRLAAVAPVIANIPENISTEELDHKISILSINGTEDPLVPYEGGFVHVNGKDYGEVISARDSTDYFVEGNDLPRKPSKRTELPNTDPEDGCRVVVTEYTESGNPYEVFHYKVVGGGHNWPGPAKDPFDFFDTGNSCRDFDATQVIWAFFKRQEKGR